MIPMQWVKIMKGEKNVVWVKRGAQIKNIGNTIWYFKESGKIMGQFAEECSKY